MLTGDAVPCRQPAGDDDQAVTTTLPPRRSSPARGSCGVTDRARLRCPTPSARYPHASDLASVRDLDRAITDGGVGLHPGSAAGGPKGWCPSGDGGPGLTPGRVRFRGTSRMPVSSREEEVALVPIAVGSCSWPRRQLCHAGCPLGAATPPPCRRSRPRHRGPFRRQVTPRGLAERKSR
jgi:hypothetical protein